MYFIKERDRRKRVILLTTNVVGNLKTNLNYGRSTFPLKKKTKNYSTSTKINRPVETKGVHCTATYGKIKKFQWIVTRGQITLSALNSRLRICFTFPDGTRNKHIVINRECGNRSQQSWTLSQIKTLFGPTVDSYIDLLRFDGESAETLTQPITKRRSNKTRVYFVGGVKVCPEYELSGIHGKGLVDWAIKIGDAIIVVTEAKIDINQRVGQNAIQLQASSQRNKKERTCNEALHEVVTSIVSTGNRLKLVTTGDCNDIDNSGMSRYY
ncbi:hypothetical protein GLOIN_2v1033202 [Rhizophagus clarus]|uniref:Uncharacterized protein n=1 Tax=Rhizophagus clarus TaxID=94130 RepID=A0A8H3QMQ9_9GLOM|nr:hypothetical protein GLOIN_2v1033202 [Rhizophagus clarus]